MGWGGLLVIIKGRLFTWSKQKIQKEWPFIVKALIANRLWKRITRIVVTNYTNYIVIAKGHHISSLTDNLQL